MSHGSNTTQADDINFTKQ